MGSAARMRRLQSNYDYIRDCDRLQLPEPIGRARKDLGGAFRERVETKGTELEEVLRSQGFERRPRSGRSAQFNRDGVIVFIPVKILRRDRILRPSDLFRISRSIKSNSHSVAPTEERETQNNEDTNTPIKEIPIVASGNAPKSKPRVIKRNPRQ